MNLDAEHQKMKIVFPVDFDERGEWEAEQRGLLADVRVCLDGKAYTLSFFTPDRVNLEFQLDLNRGGICLAYPGLVLVAVVNRDTIREAILALLKTDYFEHLAFERM